jgi:hypothetical protein
LKTHAAERALQRYNIELTKYDETEILNKIKNNQIIPLGASENDRNRKFCYVEYNHIPLKILYQRTNKGPVAIITAYPFDTDEYNLLMQNDFEKKINNAVAFLKRNGFIVYKRKRLTKVHEEM